MWINFTDKELEIVKQALSRKVAFHLVSSHVDETKAVQAVEDKIKEVASWRRPEDPVIIQRARELYADDETEIDDDPAVSHADDGTWVAAWVWVSDEEAGLVDDDEGEDPEEEICRTCGEAYNGYSDGYDGECPDCADKTDQKLHPEIYQ